MTKRGRKPPKDSKLPDPKVWKWCKHPECQENCRISNFPNTEDQQRMMRDYPVFCAILGEDYCWEHLSKKARAKYKNKIEKWVKQGRSLESANLFNANLQETNLNRANLQKANLIRANLQKADLWNAKLQEADLSKANLQEAHLWYAKLQKADLWNAKLQEADLEEAELNGTFLARVQLDGVKELTWEQLEDSKGNVQIGEERSKSWSAARDAYRRLKNYFHQQGLYDDESQAYYREKLMAKHEEHEKLFGKRWRVTFKTAKKTRLRLYVWFLKGFKRTFKNIGRFFDLNENKGVRKRWLGLWILWALAGFGERWIRTIGWAVGTFVFFGLLYWTGSNLGWIILQSQVGDKIIQIKHLVNCLYFSLVTFVTLGFGDIWPALAAWPAKILVGLEVILGYVFLGMIVVLIARKFGR